MTTKKFAQMTTKKLNALLATASDEDKKAIEAVLAAREQAQTPKAEEIAEVSAAEETSLTPEEEAAIKAAEENGGINPLYNGSKATQEKKPKMTDEERHTLAEELKKNMEESPALTKHMVMNCRTLLLQLSKKARQERR